MGYISGIGASCDGDAASAEAVRSERLSHRVVVVLLGKADIRFEPSRPIILAHRAVPLGEALQTIPIILHNP